MMKLRKWSSLNKAEKLGRKSAFIGTLIYYIPCLMLFSIPIFLCMSHNNISFLQSIFWLLTLKLPWSIIVGLIIPLLPIAYYFMIRSSCITNAYKKVTKDFSKKLAEKMLVRGEPTKIKLIRTRDGYYNDFLLKDLSGRVDYYAVLEANHNIIVIYTKFSDENEEDFFDDISNEKRNPFDFIEMEEFSSFCEVL